MWMNNSSSTLLRDDAISVNINGEKKHFVCIRAYRDNEGARLYDLFDENGQITSKIVGLIPAVEAFLCSRKLLS